MMIIEAFNQRLIDDQVLQPIAIYGDEVIFPKQYPPVMITELTEWSQLQNAFQSTASPSWNRESKLVFRAFM